MHQEQAAFRDHDGESHFVVECDYRYNAPHFVGFPRYSALVTPSIGSSASRTAPRQHVRPQAYTGADQRFPLGSRCLKRNTCRVMAIEEASES